MTNLRARFATLLGAARPLVSAIAAVGRWTGRFAVWLLAAIFGRWQWQAPPWMPRARSGTNRVFRFLGANPLLTVALMLATAFGTAWGYWLVTRPKPDYVTFTVSGPALTEYDDKGNMSIKHMVVTFSKSAAPLRLIDKAVTEGIDVSPAIAGTWTWKTDRILDFMPKSDWPVDGHFTARLAKKTAVAEHVVLADYSFTFKSQPFSAQIADSQFYQDPRDPNMKKLVATVKFSHPVDSARFEQLVSLAVAKDADYLGLSPDSRHFSVVYDKLKLSAFIHSAALGMPRDDTPMTLSIDRGVRAARGGNDTADRLQAVVTIPGRSSLRFSDARMTLVDNERYEPEQVLLVASSSPVIENAISGGITVRLLPERSPRQNPNDRRPYEWRDEGEIGDDILNASEPVKLTYVPSEDGANTSHGFKFLAPVGRWLHVVVNDNVEGVGGYISGKRYVATVKVQPYEPKLTFLGEGSLLSLTGDKKVGFLVRDLDQVDVEVGRVLPEQLQHLTPQMYTFARPGMFGGLEDRMVERFISRRDFKGHDPGKPIYDFVDMNEYLADKTQTRRGLFLLRLRGVNRGIQDARLILVTDIGFLIKREKDGSRDVFVQSIRTGLPVEGAQVELSGTNGQPVMTATTNSSGRATLPNPDPRQYRREKTPELLVVRKGDDMSFVPLNSPDREINVSRFDVGGVENAASAQQLTSYIFSDRGIYRPGETTHLAMITRTADWTGSLASIPVTVEVHDPRGFVAERTDVKLSEAAFDEINYTSQTTSPTGIYEAVAYIVRPNNRRDMLGSTTFKVQEFEPDRLKVRLDLAEADKTTAAWLKPDDVKARVAVNHMFGDAATDRRVEGELSLTPAIPRFAQFPDYRFQIGEALPEPYHEQLQPQKTDAQGIAEFSLDLKRFVGHAYRVNVLARAYEAEGGRDVGAQNSAIVSSSSFLVGVKPDGDLAFIGRGLARTARFLAVNQQLAPVAAEGLSLEWVQKKYVSVLAQQPDHTMRYVSRLKETIRDTRKVSIAGGGTAFALPTQEPGDFVLVLRDGSGAELNRVSYTVAGQANISRSLERNAELQVQLDKPAYSGGDTIQVSIRAPYVGAGLITVEREKVFAYQWFKTTTTSTVQKITLPQDFEGNGYIAVQFLRDPASDEIFTSPLSYGIAPFAPNLSARQESLSLNAPKQVKPGETLTMHVAPGEASKVALLAVDEGILQVARYKNPDPLAFFFQKRMLEVGTRQILDLILPEYTRFLALAAPGGDAGSEFARQLNPFARKHKAPVAFWSGIVDVPKEGRDIRYTVPDYFNGHLRIVAIAASARRMAVAEAGTDVKGDFILTPNLPETSAPGDEFVVSVGVFNNTTGAAGPVRLDVKASAGLTLMSAAGVDLTIPDKKEATGEFRVRANPALGSATLTFTAHRASAQATVEETVGIRPPVAYRTTVSIGKTDAATATTSLTRDMYAEHRSVEASVSTLPTVWGQGLVVYLENSEYSCTEQLVSMGMGGLIVSAHPEFGTINTRSGLTPQQRLDATYTMLRTRRNDEGAMGLWSSTPDTSEFASLYAAHFLIESRDRGQRIPDDVLTSLNSWLMRFASTPASSLADGRMRAYAVYLLVRQGIRPNTQLSNVEQELTRRYPQAYTTDLAAAYLASIYRIMQRNDDADRLIRNVPWASQKRDLAGGVYYDGVVHDAQLLYLLSKHFPNRLTGVPAEPLENISASVSGNRYTSLSAAYVLLALDALAKQAGATMRFGITEIAKDNTEKALALSATSSMPKADLSQTAARVRFSKDGPLTAYYALNESGFDRNTPAAESGKGIEVFREYLDASGNPLTKVTVGQEFLARVRIRSTTRDSVPQVVVIDMSPGGVEPVLEIAPATESSDTGAEPAAPGRSQGTIAAFPGGLRPAPLPFGRASAPLPIGLPAKSNWRPFQIDVREDRVVLYGNLSKDASTFVYRLRATNAGTYQIPPVFAEGMYDRTVAGISQAGKLEIVKP